MATADSTSYADVLTAYNATAAGETLTIPAGESTWSSTLTVAKAINIIGAGASLTKITGTGTTTIMEITCSDVRVSAIGFIFTTNNTGGRSIQITGESDGSAVTDGIRIDNCSFTKGTRALQVNGWVEGVADNNTFTNCNIAVGLTGDNNHSWGRTIAAGTSDSFFIEDNTFVITNDADREPNHLVYHQEGARSVTRYNSFDGTAYTDGNSIFFDSHGNQNLYDGSGDFRGQPIIEIYENTFAIHHSYNPFIGGLRGGSVLCYNNTLTYIGSYGYSIQLTDEESWQTAFFSPLRTEWPAEDQIMNSFFWGNTRNGVAVTTINLQNANDAEFIQEDRDYFMHAPESSGGSESYPTRAGADDMTFTASGANAYYPYTAYTYPHPLRAETVSFHRNRMRIF